MPLIGLVSSDGPVVGQRDRDVGWPHGQHHSAWEEEAVIAGPAFPPTIWQQVQRVFEFNTLSYIVATCKYITQKLHNPILEMLLIRYELYNAADYSVCGLHWSPFLHLQWERPSEGFAFVSSCVYAACQPPNLVFTPIVLELQARSCRGSQSLESNHPGVAGPDRIRPDTPLCAWQRIFNMMPASICCHGYQFEIIWRAQLQTCPMMHFAWLLLVY